MSKPDTLQQIAVNIQQAAALTGISHDVIQRAIRANLLVAHYPNTRPVILVEDLRSWIETAPTESPRQYRYRPRPS